jgi:hypothetical protein
LFCCPSSDAARGKGSFIRKAVAARMARLPAGRADPSRADSLARALWRPFALNGRRNDPPHETPECSPIPCSGSSPSSP